MSDRVQQWFDQLPGFPGLLGACFTLPNQPTQARSWSAQHPVEPLVALRRQARDVADVMHTGNLPAQRLRWIYEHAVVYLETRRDGSELVLVTTLDPWTGDSESILPLILEFRNLE